MNLAAISYFYEARIAMILSGCYLGFLPEEIARSYVKKGELKAVAKEQKTFRLGVAVISRKSAQPNRARDLFLESIRNIHQSALSDAPY